MRVDWCVSSWFRIKNTHSHRRSRQRTVVVSDVSYATVYLVRNALAGIERAT